jgi:hypothetical protein
MLFAAADDSGDAHHVPAQHGLAHQGVWLMPAVLRGKVVGGLKEHGIDRVSRNKLGKFNRPGAFRFGGLQFLIGDNHVLVFVRLKAAQQIRPGHDLRACRAERLLLNAFPAFAVKLVKADSLLRGGG